MTDKLLAIGFLLFAAAIVAVIVWGVVASVLDWGKERKGGKE